MAPPPSPGMKVVNADADVFDCCICYFPLKAPIFQCNAGHFLCSTCRHKLEGAAGRGSNKCPRCLGTMARGFLRCRDAERMVEAVRVPCPNAAYGCDATPAYHNREDHLLACPHACHCPGEACVFIGSVAALQDHIADAHGWPCTAAPSRRWPFRFHFRLGGLSLRDGFNFVVTDGEDKRLFLLNVTRHPFCRVVSVICICPRAAADDDAKEIGFKIKHGGLCLLQDITELFEAIELRVPCSDLSGSLPLPDAKRRHHLVVPEHDHRDEHEHTTVTVDISTNGTSGTSVGNSILALFRRAGALIAPSS